MFKNLMISISMISFAACGSDINTIADARVTSAMQELSVGPFTFLPTPASGVLQGQARINRLPAQRGDVVAAFDPDGNCVGAMELLIWQEIAYINLQIYGTDPTSPKNDQMDPGEDFTLKLWDASTNTILDYDTALSGWHDNHGAPMDGFSHHDVYHFSALAASTTLDKKPGKGIVSAGE
ncbi:MAG: hypothetical protein QGI45_13375 [Myxococcota bacterium]|jgi:hypothetical protein|nr:hypothetical protein [Myxococcota bacterium]